eukprot:3941384-Rhodomonas_salina.9
MLLRACGTEIRYAATCVRVWCCAMSGTELAYGAMRCPPSRGTSYAMSGTELVYGATISVARCAMWRAAVAYGATRVVLDARVWCYADASLWPELKLDLPSEVRPTLSQYRASHSTIRYLSTAHPIAPYPSPLPHIA